MQAWCFAYFLFCGLAHWSAVELLTEVWNLNNVQSKSSSNWMIEKNFLTGFVAQNKLDSLQLFFKQ